MRRVAMAPQVVLSVFVTVLLFGQSVVYSDSLGERQDIVSQMLQAGSQGKGEQVTSLAARASRIPKIPQSDQKSQTQARQCNNRGLEFVRSEDFQNAALEFEKAFALNPADIEVVNNLGYSRSKLGKYDEAKKDLLYTLALAPSRVNAWFNLGGVLSHQDDSIMAAGAFYNAVLFSPKKQVTVASIQTDTQYGPPALNDAYQRVMKMVDISPGPDSSSKASSTASSGKSAIQVPQENVEYTGANAEEYFPFHTDKGYEYEMILYPPDNPPSRVRHYTQCLNRNTIHGELAGVFETASFIEGMKFTNEHAYSIANGQVFFNSEKSVLGTEHYTNRPIILMIKQGNREYSWTSYDIGSKRDISRYAKRLSEIKTKLRTFKDVILVIHTVSLGNEEFIEKEYYARGYGLVKQESFNKAGKLLISKEITKIDVK